MPTPKGYLVFLPGVVCVEWCTWVYDHVLLHRQMVLYEPWLHCIFQVMSSFPWSLMIHNFLCMSCFFNQLFYGMRPGIQSSTPACCLSIAGMTPLKVRVNISIHVVGRVRAASHNLMPSDSLCSLTLGHLWHFFIELFLMFSQNLKMISRLGCW